MANQTKQTVPTDARSCVHNPFWEVSVITNFMGHRCHVSASGRRFHLADESDIHESPTVEKTVATGRAKCRICAGRIRKGETAISFFASFTDGSYNSWTATWCHVHADCCHDPRTLRMAGIKTAGE